MIVIRIDDHREPVGRGHIHVATTKSAASRLSIMEHCTDVERIVVVHEANVASLGGRFSFLWIELSQSADRLRSLPLLLVQHAIDANGSCKASCSCSRCFLIVIERSSCIGGLLGSLGPRTPFFVAAGLSLVNATFGLFALPESLPDTLAPLVQPVVLNTRGAAVGEVRVTV